MNYMCNIIKYFYMYRLKILLETLGNLDKRDKSYCSM